MTTSRLVLAALWVGAWGLDWQPCTTEHFHWHDDESKLECATVTVPLDYDDSILSPRNRLPIQVVRLPALHQPALDSIIWNPGGPGAEGARYLRYRGAELQRASGGRHDIISFNPRGTGNTLPIACWDDPSERPPEMVATDTSALRIAFQESAQLASACYDRSKKTGNLMGTSYTARDVWEIVDALGGDRMLRFWGQSYGTTLAARVADLQPDRIDRILLDSAYPPEWYFEHPVNKQNIAIYNQVFDEFFNVCWREGENACPLKSQAGSKDELKDKVLRLLQSARETPLDKDGAHLTYADLVSLINTAHRMAYAAWDKLASMLLKLLKTEHDAELGRIIQSLRKRPVPRDPVVSKGPGSTAIRCSDEIPRYGTVEKFEILWKSIKSWSFMGDVLYQEAIECAPWRFEAKDGYRGPYPRLPGENRFLILNFKHDILTPLEGAKLFANNIDGATFVQVDGIGHVVALSHIDEVDRIIANFWIRKHLPGSHVLTPRRRYFKNE